MRAIVALQLAAILIFSFQALGDNIDPEHIQRLIDYLDNSDEDRLKEIKANYGVETNLYDVLGVCKILDKNTAAKEKAKKISKTIQQYERMDELDKYGSTDEKLHFIKSLSTGSIVRIYKVRNLYAVLARVLNLDRGPALRAHALSGIYQGRSSIGFAVEEQRTFQKAFYQIYKGKTEYTVGHNISSLSPSLISDGGFRVYENRYPIYEAGEPKWFPLQPGSLTLSYEKEDMRVVEGLQYSDFYPQLTDYRHIYRDGEKILVPGGFIYGDLKDQIFKINDSFMTSYAFRVGGNVLPETHFIMTKRCELVNPSDCPNQL